jgi:hypothetical protein
MYATNYKAHSLVNTIQKRYLISRITVSNCFNSRQSINRYRVADIIIHYLASTIDMVLVWRHCFHFIDSWYSPFLCTSTQSADMVDDRLLIVHSLFCFGVGRCSIKCDNIHVTISNFQIVSFLSSHWLATMISHHCISAVPNSCH